MMARRRAPKSGAEQPAAPPQMVVGIGASAGGLKALQQFFEAVPADSGMAFVVIVHLDPERQSRMRELVQDRSAIPVTQVNASTEVEANHIYIIPPDQDLSMQGGRLELRRRGKRSDRAPIDLFFRTLAEAWGPAAAGVVLSGTGADGTAGIRYIREAGGLTVAQAPDEADYDGMPTSAIGTGLVDLVLPSAQIPSELLRLRRVPDRLEEGTLTAETEPDLLAVLAVLRSRTGHDFTLYNRATLLRRLERRLRFNQVTTLAEYQPLLQSSAQECQALLRDLLISVSSFFRDPAAYRALAQLTPALFEGKGAGDAVRVWIVGCATGEEAYSIGIVLAEHAATLAEPPRLQLFATDIDERGYGFARAGLYSADAVASMSPERLRRYFTKESGGYRIAKALREQVLFAGHNVLQDPPFSRMDLVSCRNLFIYLQPEAQERVLETFHFALNPGGVLFLGASEAVGDGGLFASAGNGQRLYRRKASPYRVMPRLSAADPRVAAPAPAAVPGGAASDPQAFSYGALHLRLLEQYAPASVVVNERLDVVHLSGGAGAFLRLGGGTPTHNVLQLARPDLRHALRTSLRQAFADGRPVARRLTTEVDGGRRQVSVHVRPSVGTDAADRHALVVFETTSAAAGEPDEAALAGAEQELEAELRRTRDQLESTSAAHDRTVAELQIAVEELRSINEEQKAAAEELETGREEIQSINEELTSINQEHQGTIEELKRTNADLQNLIESTDIGTIFLDRNLCVRRYTPAIEGLFNLIGSDVGRPITHVTHRLKYDGLLADVASVLASLGRIEREVEGESGQFYIVRIGPYRSLDGDHDGVVLTFFDHTSQQRNAEALREAKRSAEAANQAKNVFLATLSHEFRTPLNSILGYADLLSLDGSLSPPQEQKIQRLKAGAWHLEAMINQILGFVRLDSGRETVDAVSLDARAVALEAGSLLEGIAKAKGLALVLDVPDEPLRVVTDGAKLRQILVNLCSNAVKYTVEGEVRLRVRMSGDRISFEVSDTGIGIAPEHHERIYERFWQVEGGPTRVDGGLGIGLAAVREYARLLGGDVGVESALGKGSTFRLWLPVE